MTNRVLILGILGVALAFGATEARAACPASLEGVWRGNDGGTYYVRRNASQIWWVGMSGDDGKSWTHAFKGNRNGNMISGVWADVRGAHGSGAMTVRVRNPSRLDRVSLVGSGFTGTRWTRDC